MSRDAGGPRGRAGAGRAFPLLASLALALASGCGPSFRVEDMAAKSLRTPYDTIDYFRYALRREDWGAVYHSLSAETRRYIDEHWLGRAFFGSVFARKELDDIDPHAPPTLAHMKVVELIHRAETLSIEEREKETIVQLYYQSPENPSEFLAEAIPILPERDADGKVRWRVGIAEWLKEKQP
jgi:hypothetical protein